MLPFYTGLKNVICKGKDRYTCAFGGLFLISSIVLNISCVFAQSQSYPTLREPMDCCPPGSSVHEISLQEYWSWLTFPSPGDLPRSGIESVPPAVAGGFFTTEPSGKTQQKVTTQ